MPASTPVPIPSKYSVDAAPYWLYRRLWVGDRPDQATPSKEGPPRARRLDEQRVRGATSAATWRVQSTIAAEPSIASARLRARYGARSPCAASTPTVSSDIFR